MSVDLSVRGTASPSPGPEGDDAAALVLAAPAPLGGSAAAMARLAAASPHRSDGSLRTVEIGADLVAEAGPARAVAATPEAPPPSLARSSLQTLPSQGAAASATNEAEARSRAPQAADPEMVSSLLRSHPDERSWAGAHPPGRAALTSAGDGEAIFHDEDWEGNPASPGSVAEGRAASPPSPLGLETLSSPPRPVRASTTSMKARSQVLRETRKPLAMRSGAVVDASGQAQLPAPPQGASRPAVLGRFLRAEEPVPSRSPPQARGQRVAARTRVVRGTGGHAGRGVPVAGGAPSPSGRASPNGSMHSLVSSSFPGRSTPGLSEGPSLTLGPENSGVLAAAAMEATDLRGRSLELPAFSPRGGLVPLPGGQASRAASPSPSSSPGVHRAAPRGMERLTSSAASPPKHLYGRQAGQLPGATASAASLPSPPGWHAETAEGGGGRGRAPSVVGLVESDDVALEGRLPPGPGSVKAGPSLSRTFPALAAAFGEEIDGRARAAAAEAAAAAAESLARSREAQAAGAAGGRPSSPLGPAGPTYPSRTHGEGRVVLTRRRGARHGGRGGPSSVPPVSSVLMGSGELPGREGGAKALVPSSTAQPKLDRVARAARRGKGGPRRPDAPRTPPRGGRAPGREGGRGGGAVSLGPVGREVGRGSTASLGPPPFTEEELVEASMAELEDPWEEERWTGEAWRDETKEGGAAGGGERRGRRDRRRALPGGPALRDAVPPEAAAAMAAAAASSGRLVRGYSSASLASPLTAGALSPELSLAALPGDVPAPRLVGGAPVRQGLSVASLPPVGMALAPRLRGFAKSSPRNAAAASRSLAQPHRRGGGQGSGRAGGVAARAAGLQADRLRQSIRDAAGARRTAVAEPGAPYGSDAASSGVSLRRPAGSLSTGALPPPSPVRARGSAAAKNGLRVPSALGGSRAAPAPEKRFAVVPLEPVDEATATFRRALDVLSGPPASRRAARGTAGPAPPDRRRRARGHRAGRRTGQRPSQSRAADHASGGVASLSITGAGGRGFAEGSAFASMPELPPAEPLHRDGAGAGAATGPVATTGPVWPVRKGRGEAERQGRRAGAAAATPMQLHQRRMIRRAAEVAAMAALPAALPGSAGEGAAGRADPVARPGVPAELYGDAGGQGSGAGVVTFRPSPGGAGPVSEPASGAAAGRAERGGGAGGAGGGFSPPAHARVTGRGGPVPGAAVAARAAGRSSPSGHGAVPTAAAHVGGTGPWDGDAVDGGEGTMSRGRPRVGVLRPPATPSGWATEQDWLAGTSPMA